MTECPYMKRLHVRYKVHKLSLATLPKHLRTSPVEDCYSGRRYAMYNGYFEKMTTGFCDRSDCQGLILLKCLKDCDRSFGSEKSCLCVEIVILNPLNSTWRLLPPLYTPRDVHPEARLTVDGADVNVSVRYETYSEKYKYPDDHRRERLPDSKKTGDFTWVYSRVCNNQWMSCAQAEASPVLTTLPVFKVAVPESSATYVVRGETLVIPVLPNKCEVWGLHSSKGHWVLLSYLPDDMMAQVRGPYVDEFDEDEWDLSVQEPKAPRVVSDKGLQPLYIHGMDESKDVFIVAIELVGDVFFITLCGGGEYLRHIVANHAVKRLWQIILCDHPPRPPRSRHRYDSDDESEMILKRRFSLDMRGKEY